ncbi:MAG: 16S rRNA (cytosine(1402)-N(4))-methyltransferase RsmH [Xanthomonadales bacterium]|nr:16S rRNA (cytosine(1402)-N(4))-methyltransferase RsmH [Xanthomonadales bacterium]
MSAPGLHRPVLLAEAVSALAVSADGSYLDATFGRGGHSRNILDALSADGRLYAIDRDPDAVAHAEAQLADDPRFSIWHGAFANLDRGLREMGCEQRLDGILFDLGVSSPQLDEGARGFSFRADGPLDMRMDPTCGESAAEWLAHVGEGELAKVLRDYGEERYARRIARAIVARRSEKPFTRTADLAQCISAASPSREKDKHPATRAFQAIRIRVNDELGEIEAALEAAVRRLAPGGRLVVISFHSLEDRIVKNFIRHESRHTGGRRLPMPEERPLRLRPVGKPTWPDASECDENPRARSAVMRVAERTDAA